MWLFFQEVTKQENFSEWSKTLGEVLFLMGSNIITFLVTRRKNESDIFKNIADAHKSEAETTETNAKTISSLTKDLNASIEIVRTLRRHVEELEDETSTLRDSIIRLIKPIIKSVERLVDQIIIDSCSSEVRRMAVLILEHLYKIKDFLIKKEPE